MKWQLFCIFPHKMGSKYEASITLIAASTHLNPALCSRLMVYLSFTFRGRSVQGPPFSCKDYSAGDINVLDAVKARDCSHWQNTQNSLMSLFFHRFYVSETNPQMLIVETELLTKPERRRGALVLTAGETLEAALMPLTDIRHVKLAFLFASCAAALHRRARRIAASKNTSCQDESLKGPAEMRRSLLKQDNVLLLELKQGGDAFNNLFLLSCSVFTLMLQYCLSQVQERLHFGCKICP